MGIRVDYLSPILYAIDLVWIILFSVTSFQLRVTSYKKYLSFGNLLIGLFVAVNVLTAMSPWVAGYRWLRMFQLLWVVNYVRKNQKLTVEYLRKIIPVWIIGESLLGMGQIAKGGSLNGIFYWLGERNFSFFTIGIAQLSVVGQGLVRAYGTFSHPNSLAGFLLVSLVMWTRLRNEKQVISNKIKNIWWWGVFWVGTMGVFLCGSRLGWILVIGLVIYNFKFLISNDKLDKKKLTGAVMLMAGLGLLGMALININYKNESFLGGWDKAGWDKRINLSLASVKMVRERWWTGVGLGNFVVALPRYGAEQKFYWMQPVHNIGLLALSEVGVLGTIIISWWVVNKSEKWKLKRNFGWMILLVIGSTGLVDHYWWTLPQNNWLLAIVLGIL